MKLNFRVAIVLLFTVFAVRALAEVESPEEQECVAQGGRWAKVAFSTGEFKCFTPNPDFGKECSDGSSCKSGMCVVTQIEMNGEIWENPKGSCLNKSQFIGNCYNGVTPFNGCHWFLESGRCKSRCLN